MPFSLSNKSIWLEILNNETTFWKHGEGFSTIQKLMIRQVGPCYEDSGSQTVSMYQSPRGPVNSQIARPTPRVP